MNIIKSHAVSLILNTKKIFTPNLFLKMSGDSDLETEVRVLKKYLKHLAEKPQDVYPMNCIDVIFHEWVRQQFFCEKNNNVDSLASLTNNKTVSYQARKTERGRAHRKEAVDQLLQCTEESHERISS